MELATLSDIARIMSRVDSFDEKASQVVERLAQVSEADWVGLRVPDERLLGLRLVASAGYANLRLPLPKVLAYDQGMSGRAFQASRPIVTQDYPKHPDAQQHHVDAGEKSTLALPILFDGRVTGVFTFGSRELGHFTHERVGLLESVAYQLGPLLENARLQYELAVTDEIARIITSTLDIGDAYDQFAVAMKELVNFDRASIVTIDTEGGTCTTRYVHGVDVPEWRAGSTRPLDGSWTQRVVASGVTIVRANASQGHRRYAMDEVFERLGFKSNISIPLISAEEAMGMLRIYSRTPGAFASREQAILERLANQIAPAVANAQLYQARKRAEEEEHRAAEENRVMAEIGRVAGHSLNIGEVYAHLGEAVRELIPFDRMSLSLIDQEEGTTTPTWVIGEDIRGRFTGDAIPLAGTLANEVFCNKSGLMMEAETEEDVSHKIPGILPAFRSGLRSFLAVPLVDRDAVIGVFQIRSKLQNIYSQRHLDLAAQVANQIAGAIANSQLFEQSRKAEESERQRSEELRSLLEVVSVLNHPGSFESKVSMVMEELARVCDARSATFRVPDEGGLRRIGHFGEQPVGTDYVSYEGNIPGLVFERNELVVVNDYPSYHLAVSDHVRLGIRSLLAAPLVSQESVVGVVIVNSYESNHFTQERVSLVLGIINGLGSLLENARLEDERQRTEERMSETARLASIGELAAGVAHEINNPLTSVLGYSEMLMRSNIPEQFRKDIETISDEAQRAAKIVKNLLFFARKSGTEKLYTDPNAIVNRALEMKSYDFKVNNISVTGQLSPDIPKTMIDEHQLVQVFLNILTNAEQVIHQANGRGQIQFDTKASANGIEITIRDDGPGMPPEELARIFEPFFTTKEVGQGTGLGLSISYGIVKEHGGEIRAESVEGEGTTFYITLPVVAPKEAAGSPAAPPSDTDRTTKHLLVVDDEPHIRNLLQKYLELERYTVDLASDGQEAWRKLANMDYSCVILDLKMPGMSGPELYQRMQGISETLASKVVFISGDRVSPDTREFVSQTGNPLITKPFNLEEMLQTVQNIWDRLPVTT
jgi:signal transduction histidine kinase